MYIRIPLFAALMGLSTSALAHDMSDDIEKFNKLYAVKNIDGNEAKAAKVYFERALAQSSRAEEKLLLKIRSITNAGLKELGEQPALLASEIKRLEAAVVTPKVADQAKLAKAKELLQQARAEYAAYQQLDTGAVDEMKQAVTLMENSPNK